MLYAVIDTTIWMSILINRDINDPNLEAIHQFSNTGKIRFLSCSALAAEWDKHRAEIVKNIENDYSKKIKAKSLGDDISSEEIENLQNIKERLLHQVMLIDEIYAKATYIDESDVIKVKVFDADRNNKAPFHTKRKSKNDALIIYSALEFMKEKIDSTLFFISSNHNDFCHPDTIPHVLHPDFQIQYPTVSILHLMRISDFISQLRDRGVFFSRKLGYSKPSIANIVSIDKSLTLEKQILAYLDAAFDGLAVLPKHLFARHYPFLIGENITLSEAAYELFTDNEKVVDLFTRYYHHPDDQSIDREAVAEIAYFLRGNLVDHLIGEDRKEIELLVKNEKTFCKCSLCCYRRMDFIGAFEAIDSERKSGSINEKMRCAYLLFITGHFIDANQLLQDLLKDRSLTKTQRFLICYNLVNLHWAIRQSFRIDGNLGEQVLSQLADIDLKKEQEQSTHIGNRATIHWIANNTFYNKTLADAHKYNSKIRDLYHSKSSGTHLESQKLMERLYCLTEFIERNGVFYHFSSSFNELCQTLTEGVFASYACNNEMSGKVGFFTEYVLEKLIYFSEPELIRKYRRRYKITDIKCKEGEDGIGGFLIKSQTLFTQAGDVAKLVAQKNEDIIETTTRNAKWDDTYFIDVYERVVLNSITLAAVIKLNAEEVQSFFNYLEKFLVVPQNIHPYKLIEALHFFVINRGAIMSNEHLIGLFKYLLIKGGDYGDNAMYDVLDLLKDRNLKISIDETELDSLLHDIKEHEQDYVRDNTWDKVCMLPLVLEEDQKNKVTIFIQEHIKAHFESERFYRATMYELAPPDTSEIERYDDHIRTRLKRGNKRAAFVRKPFFHDMVLDKYCNFYFKYNITMPADIREAMILLDPYYAWLLDMDTFDYSQFNPEWVKNHFTLYFKLKYRQSKVLQKHWLEAILQNNGDLELMHYYIYSYDMPIIEEN
ncbi:PIN domain-containing protein [Sediminibacterium sp.]|uniref:PIN domain-containing protein n=1 Tax=Sediminibacterium sp. TaxID=1917865 RepID=UPI002734E6AD|nr:PIN domain-containing protein [Sediminibacterium sp.]MDP3393872.1 PIN domain-containing protein [Sediminibacterium sp.]MDP3568798.1 PIN domain-containing protein [Sediminibacterium sp.]